MTNIVFEPTKQEMMRTIMHLMGKLQEYAAEDSLANKEGRGCFSDPEKYISEVMHDASRILGRYHHGQTTVQNSCTEMD